MKMTGEPTPIPKRERFNPALNETFEAVGPHLIDRFGGVGREVQI